MGEQEEALRAVAERKTRNAPLMIENASLPAGSPMYYYCHGCSALVAVKPEEWYLDPPPKHCPECLPLAQRGWL